MFGAGAALGQPQGFKVSLGLTGGVPLTTSNRSFDESRRYTFGPRVDLRLAPNIELTINPLYKRKGSGGSFEVHGDVEGPVLLAFRNREHSLELPVIGNLYLRGDSKRLRPFVGTGFTLRTDWGHATTDVLQRDTPSGPLRPRTFTSDYRTEIRAGATAAAGAAWRRGRVTFVPEIRYTYWGEGARGNRNQVDALLSIRF